MNKITEIGLKAESMLDTLSNWNIRVPEFTLLKRALEKVVELSLRLEERPGTNTEVKWNDSIESSSTVTTRVAALRVIDDWINEIQEDATEHQIVITDGKKLIRLQIAGELLIQLIYASMYLDKVTMLMYEDETKD